MNFTVWFHRLLGHKVVSIDYDGIWSGEYVCSCGANWLWFR